jgi:ribosome-binding factor A
VKRQREQRRGTAPATPGRRVERVAGEVQRLLSSLLVQRVSDPRLENVIVTRVQMTPDLRLARMWVHSLAVEVGDHASILKGLEAAAPFFRRELAQGLDLRFTPELRFFWDDQLDDTRRIATLLRGAKRPEPDEDEGGG